LQYVFDVEKMKCSATSNESNILKKIDVYQFNTGADGYNLTRIPGLVGYLKKFLTTLKTNNLCFTPGGGSGSGLSLTFSFVY
jgi:hypothetical protein